MLAPASWYYSGMSLLVITDPKQKVRAAFDTAKLRALYPGLNVPQFSKHASDVIRTFVKAWHDNPLGTEKPEWVVYIHTMIDGQDESPTQEAGAPEVQPGG